MQIPVQVYIDGHLTEAEIAGASGQNAALVSRLLAAQARQAATGKEIADLKELLAKLPAGRYAGNGPGESLLVVAETTALKPGEPQIEAARKICGGYADVLFNRVESVAYKPVDGLRDIARVLLTPRRYNQLVALCEVPVKAYVRS